MVVCYGVPCDGSQPVCILRVVVKIHKIPVICDFRWNIKHPPGIVPLLQLQHNILITIQHGYGGWLVIQAGFILVVKLNLPKFTRMGFNDKYSIGSLGTVGVVLLALTAWRIRHAWFRHVLSLCGIAILIGFVLLEAAPIHLTDVLDMSIPISDKRQILEVFGISCFGLSAIMNLWRCGRKRVRSS